MRKTRWRGWSRLLLVFEEKNADGDGGGKGGREKGADDECWC